MEDEDVAVFGTSTTFPQMPQDSETKALANVRGVQTVLPRRAGVGPRAARLRPDGTAARDLERSGNAGPARAPAGSCFARAWSPAHLRRLGSG